MMQFKRQFKGEKKWEAVSYKEVEEKFGKEYVSNDKMKNGAKFQSDLTIYKKLSCNCPAGYHELFLECRGY